MAAVAGGIAAGLSLSGPPSRQAGCESPSALASLMPGVDLKRMWFKYEKRIRDFSTQDKVFEYFACSQRNGERVMSASDALRALLPIYPPDDAAWVRSGSLPGENAPDVPEDIGKKHEDFFKQFDVDGDGALSYTEYLLLLVLLAVPLRDMRSIFSIMDSDGNGTLEREEFLDVIHTLQLQSSKNASAVPRTGFGGGSGELTGGIIETWFGKAGDQHLRLQDFIAFLVRLHAVFDDMEFTLLDTRRDGTITGTDMARSFVAAASIKCIDRLLDRVQDMDDSLKATRIDRDSFMAVQQMRKKYHRISFALRFWQETGHHVDERAFIKLVRDVCKTEISQEVAQIFFACFRDDDGNWDVQAMSTALKHKDSGIGGLGKSESLLDCLIGCVRPVQP